MEAEPDDSRRCEADERDGVIGLLSGLVGAYRLNMSRLAANFLLLV